MVMDASLAGRDQNAQALAFELFTFVRVRYGVRRVAIKELAVPMGLKRCVLALAAIASVPALAQDEGDEGIRIIPPSSGSPIAPPPPPAPTSEPRAQLGPPSILAIFAHPDDEIMIAPVLSRAIREQSEVTLVFATSGAQGPGVSGMEPGAELAELRESEAACASFALGMDDPIFWRLDDGSLARRSRDPDSAAVDMRERIAALIELQQPQVIMTWGPDGGYGHSDHRALSNVVTEVVQTMGPERPELLYVAIPAEDREGVPGIDRWATVHPSLITDRLRYELADIEAARFAIDCYQSQFDESARSVLPSLLHQHVWRGSVHFRFAFPGTERGSTRQRR